MRLSSDMRQMAARIAVMAVLLVTLAPLVSALIFASRHSESFIGSICSTRPAAIAGSPVDQAPTSPERHDLHFKHCAYCLTQAFSAAILPAGGDGMRRPAPPARLLPYLFYHASGQRPAWNAAQPRGPPANI